VIVDATTGAVLTVGHDTQKDESAEEKKSEARKSVRGKK